MKKFELDGITGLILDTDDIYNKSTIDKFSHDAKMEDYNNLLFDYKYLLLIRCNDTPKYYKCAETVEELMIAIEDFIDDYLYAEDKCFVTHKRNDGRLYSYRPIHSICNTNEKYNNAQDKVFDILFKNPGLDILNYKVFVCDDDSNYKFLQTHYELTLELLKLEIEHSMDHFEEESIIHGHKVKYIPGNPKYKYCITNGRTNTKSYVNDAITELKHIIIPVNELSIKMCKIREQLNK